MENKNTVTVYMYDYETYVRPSYFSVIELVCEETEKTYRNISKGSIYPKIIKKSELDVLNGHSMFSLTNDLNLFKEKIVAHIQDRIETTKMRILGLENSIIKDEKEIDFIKNSMLGGI